MQGKKKTEKKEVRLFTLTGPATWWSFNPESHNSSSHYQELHNKAQALMLAKKAMMKKKQTFLVHSASCLVQLQARVTKFKLSLPRASQSGPSFDARQKENEKNKIKLLTLTWPAAWWIFNPESHNSSSRYPGHHNWAQPLMHGKIFF
jgi:hypothetical protein